MCNLASLQANPFNAWNQTQTKTTKAFKPDTHRVSSKPDADYQHYKTQLQDTINQLRNQQRDQLFKRQLQTQYPVFQNKWIPKHQLNHFLSLLEQHQPRSAAYRYTYPKLKSEPSLTKFNANDKKQAPTSKKKSDNSILESLLKTGWNWWKRFVI